MHLSFYIDIMFQESKVILNNSYYELNMLRYSIIMIIKKLFDWK